MKLGVLRGAALTIAMLSANLSRTEVRAAPTEMKMDRVLKENLDTFFSNFSEASVPPFSKGRISDKELIYFGIKHNEINKPKRIQQVHGNPSSDQKIAAKLIEPSVEWYFGRKITKHQSTPGYAYKNGYYYWMGGDGEGPTFSQITRLVDIGKGYYTASVSIYGAANGWEGNPHGTMSEWRRPDDGSGVPELNSKMTARIRKVGTGATQHYILVEYLKAK